MTTRRFTDGWSDAVSIAPPAFPHWDALAHSMRAEPGPCRHELEADDVRQCRAGPGGGLALCALCGTPVFVPPA